MTSRFSDGSERKRRRVDDCSEIEEDKDSMIEELKKNLSEAERRIEMLERELTDFKQKSEEKSTLMTTFEVEEDEVIPPSKRTKRAPQLVPTMFSLNETGGQTTMTGRPRLDRFASIQTKMVIDKLPTIQRGANATVLRVLEKIDGAVTSVSYTHLTLPTILRV